MWKASHLPIDANNLNRSLIVSTLHFLSSSSPPFLSSATRKLYTSPLPLQKLLIKALEQNSSRKLQYFHVRSSFLVSATPMATVAHHLSTNSPRASSSSESSTGAGREILVQHLLVKGDDVKLLLELQKRIAKGEDMSDLAVDYSICPSKEEGGMLGWVRRGQMVPEFEEAAFGAPLNRVVKCKTKFGWHLLLVLSEREESVLEDIQPDRLHEKLQDPCFLEAAQLIDVREPHEVEQASLPGFQILPLRQFGNWGPEITTKFDPQKDTYVLCHHGVRSLQVAQWLQTQGFKKVFNIAGGIHAYAVKVDPSVPTY